MEFAAIQGCCKNVYLKEDIYFKHKSEHGFVSMEEKSNCSVDLCGNVFGSVLIIFIY